MKKNDKLYITIIVVLIIISIVSIYNNINSLSEPKLAVTDPHFCMNIANNLLLSPAMLPIAEFFIQKGIKENTIENQRQVYPDMSSEDLSNRQNLEFGWLYSQYAWLHIKNDNPKDALEKIRKAIDFKNMASKPEVIDYLRLGIIQYKNELKKEGWDNITKAILLDSQIEKQDPDYISVLKEIVSEKKGNEDGAIEFIKNYREQNREVAPDLILNTLSNNLIKLREIKDKVVFVSFFSPTCGSCRLELPKIKKIHEKYSSKDDILFLFILNKPQMKKAAIKLMKEIGYEDITIGTVENGSVWNYISAEPTIWIIDKQSKIASKFQGTKNNSERIYEEEILSLF